MGTDPAGAVHGNNSWYLLAKWTMFTEGFLCRLLSILRHHSLHDRNIYGNVQRPKLAQKQNCESVLWRALLFHWSLDHWSHHFVHPNAGWRRTKLGKSQQCSLLGCGSRLR